MLWFDGVVRSYGVCVDSSRAVPSCHTARTSGDRFREPGQRSSPSWARGMPQSRGPRGVRRSVAATRANSSKKSRPSDLGEARDLASASEQRGASQRCTACGSTAESQRQAPDGRRAQRRAAAPDSRTSI